MKLNGLQLDNYSFTANAQVCFQLHCTMAEAVALDGQNLIATDNDGKITLATFLSYTMDSVINAGNGNIIIYAYRHIDDSTKTAINELTASVNSLTSLKTDLADVKATVSQLADNAGVSNS